MQEKASKILAGVSRHHLQRTFLWAWEALVVEVQEQRRVKEERREQALAACLVGTRKRPTPRKSLSPLPPPKVRLGYLIRICGITNDAQLLLLLLQGGQSSRTHVPDSGCGVVEQFDSPCH